MNIVIASDHTGVAQKAAIIKHLQGQGHVVGDLGPSLEDSVDYPDFAELVARAVASGQAEIGVLLCGTGIGMAIAANKVQGIRAANVTSPELARLAREHNDANVLTLSGRFVNLDDNIQIVDAFLATAFAAGRHVQRVEKIAGLESPSCASLPGEL